MAAPVITCPACTKKFKGKEGLEGKRIKCPLCATPFVVPSNLSDQVKAGSPDAVPQSAVPQSKVPAKSTAPVKVQAESKNARVTWDKEDDDGSAYTLGQFDLRARCPNCANLMESEEAVVCLFCGYNTMTREWGATVKAVAVTGGQHFLHLLPAMIFFILLLSFFYGLLFFCLHVPDYVVNSWASFLDHESMRMWIIGFMLAFMWVFGVLSYRRLIANPKPKERVKTAEDQKKK